MCKTIVFLVVKPGFQDGWNLQIPDSRNPYFEDSRVSGILISKIHGLVESLFRRFPGWWNLGLGKTIVFLVVKPGFPDGVNLQIPDSRNPYFEDSRVSGILI